MAATLDALVSRREQLLQELAKSERMIYDLETAYLSAEYSQMGTVLKGLEGFLSSKDALRKRARAFRVEDRAFSLSSRTSPATSELEEAQAELNEIAAVGRGKGTYATKSVAQKGRR